MTNSLITITPEHLEVANCFLQYGNIPAVAKDLGLLPDRVVEILNVKEVKRYIDNVYLDMGYRNRNNIAAVMDEIIQSKLEQAAETGLYSSKDLVDIMQIAHKMRMDEIKAMQDSNKTEIRNQTNVQINDASTFGSGNYGKLMEKLIGGSRE